MKKNYLFLCLLVLSGCSPVVSDGTTQTVQPTVLATLTIHATATATDDTIQMVTPIATSANTSDPSKMVLGSEMMCAQKQVDRDFADIANTQLLTTTDWSGASEYALMDLQKPGSRLELSTMKYLEISPDQKHLFYLDCPTSSYEECSYVLSDGQNVLKTYPRDSKKENWQAQLWLDEQHVLISTSPPNPNFLVLNPFTGEENAFSPYLPGVYLYPIQTMAATFSPDLKKSAYFTRVGGDRVVFWDMDRRKELAYIPTSSLYEGRNRGNDWSPNRSKLMVVGLAKPPQDLLEELFIVGIDGMVQQVTHFSDFYQTVLISAPSWSPDGRFIAFQAQVSARPGADWSEMKSHLMLADLETQKVINLCEEYGNSEDAVWSPDSRYIAITSSSQSSAWILIIDVNTGRYRSVPNREGTPVGWITSPNP